MFDYGSYLKNNDALTFEESLEIYTSMCEALEHEDEYLHELWYEIILSAENYSKMRVEWNYFSRDDRQNKDKLRTSLHNTFIINLKALHKLCVQLKIKDNWFEKLGPSENRKRWGDFAGYIMCFETIKAR